MSTRLKPRVNRDIYIQTLRRMTPEQRLAKALELSDMTREALRAGLKRRFPKESDAELDQRFRERLERCRSRSC